MPVPPRKVTITFTVHDGDDTTKMPNVGLIEHVQVGFSLEDHQWVVTSEEKTVWSGRADDRIGAMLDYLKSRLGLDKEVPGGDA